MKRILLPLLLLCLACGAPAQAMLVIPTATNLPQLATSVPIPSEHVGRVLVPLTVRSQPNADAQSLGFLQPDTPVMGTCRTFGEDVWLELGPERYVAVVYEGRRFVKGICE